MSPPFKVYLKKSLVRIDCRISECINDFTYWGKFDLIDDRIFCFDGSTTTWIRSKVFSELKKIFFILQFKNCKMKSILDLSDSKNTCIEYGIELSRNFAQNTYFDFTFTADDKTFVGYSLDIFISNRFF